MQLLLISIRWRQIYKTFFWNHMITQIIANCFQLLSSQFGLKQRSKLKIIETIVLPYQESDVEELSVDQELRTFISRINWNGI
ncbi:unnamed protein product [Paramecium octaurelia]|uniref:Uncharacterized protein n=1 Tax=Paramecium octaurelia TaxID=43137 RepID=A0A8S1V6Q8_PAROT|nr:unnamed protein product [Paramecium octaurelia]